MGPIIILDKSAFQMLSKREHRILGEHFSQNVTPVLRYEVLGDLSKKVLKGRDSHERVMDLARKLSGVGGFYNMNYQDVCATTLLGAMLELDGRVFPEDYSVHGDSMYVDATRVSMQIANWAAGNFTSRDEGLSKIWREETRSMSFEGLNRVLNRHRVLIPPPATAEKIVSVADELLALRSLQPVWLDWILEQGIFSIRAKEAIRMRQRAESAEYLSDLSSYAHHCIRVLLSLVVAVRHGYLKWDPTHLIDVQYLYYLPFCMVFTSDDHVHRLLAPQLRLGKVKYKDAQQSFVSAQELKRGLRELADDFDSLDAGGQSRRRFALGHYPPAIGSGVINRIWKVHCGGWHGSGNRAIQLTKEESDLAAAEAKALIAAEELVETGAGA